MGFHKKQKAMVIEIWSDIMCPFCYIGKRRLESALQSFTQADKIQIVWKSFLLNPDMVTDPSKNSLEYLSENKGWSMAQTRQITQQVVAMAKEVGLEYDMENTVVANAKRAHQVLQLAKSLGKGDAMKERFLKAYFTEGRNIDDTDTLIELAGNVGISKEMVQSALASREFAPKVEQDVHESQVLGIRGVPFFVFDRKYAISGAQPSSVFEQTLDKAWSEFAERNSQSLQTLADGAACDVSGSCD